MTPDRARDLLARSSRIGALGLLVAFVGVLLLVMALGMHAIVPGMVSRVLGWIGRCVVGVGVLAVVADLLFFLAVASWIRDER